MRWKLHLRYETSRFNSAILIVAVIYFYKE